MMKRLIAALLCCLPLWACNLNGSYYVENWQEIITFTDGALVSDRGVVYTIVETSSPDVRVPDVEGQRYLILFDILNANMDIRLKGTSAVDMVIPTPAGETPPAFTDPVAFQTHSVGLAYLNLWVLYTAVKNSTYRHTFSAQYALNEEGNMEVHLYHDGNHENAVDVEDEATLQYERHLINIPLQVDGKDWNLLVAYAIQADEDGNAILAPRTYTFSR